MLYFPTKIPSVVKIYYDEPSSTLFIWYTNKQERDAFRVHREFYKQQLLPDILNDRDIRGVLIYGQRRGYVEKIVNAQLISTFNYE